MLHSEAIRVAQLLLAAYPTQRAKMSDEDAAGMLSVYAAGLKDLELALVRAAIDRLVKTARWMPTVSEIRAAAAAARDGRRRAGAEAWGDVLAAIGRWGRGRSPGVDFMFADPIVARCVIAFGWRNLCESDNQHTDRARFIDAYDRVGDNDESDRIAGVQLKQLPSGTVTMAEHMKQLMGSVSHPALTTSTTDKETGER